MSDSPAAQTQNVISPAAGARLLILLAAVLWSTSSWYVRHPAFESWPPAQRGLLFAFWRALFAGGLLLPLARRPRLTFRHAPLLVCFVLMNVTYLSAMVQTTVANAIWLQNTAPVWVFLVSYFVLHHPPRRDDLMLLGFGATGVAVILCFEFLHAGAGQPWGVFLGLASGIFYGGIVLSLHVVSGDDSAWLISMSLLVTALALLPFAISDGTWPSGTQLLILAAFGLFQMGLPYVMFARGLRVISTQEAAGIVLLEPILVPLWVIHKEQPAWWTILGAAFILLGLAFRYLMPVVRGHLQGSTAE